MSPQALEVRGVSKSYVGIKALSEVSISFAPGAVHALLGENGAGKSTLTKVISGAVQPDAGEVVIGGEVRDALTPRRAADLGVRLISQERQIAFQLSVTENVLLGQMPTRGGVIDWTTAHRVAADRLARIGLTDIDVRGSIADLSVGELQMVEIARALSDDLAVLVLDEPTSALSGPAIDRLFEVIRRISDRGTAIIYISHHLEEVAEIADEFSVLCDGRHVYSGVRDEAHHDRLAELITGQPVTASTREREEVAEPGPIVLEARDVSIGTRLRGVSVGVRRGEVLCVVGGVGSGRRELARSLAGIEKPDAGSVRVGGRRLRNRLHAVREGIAFVPEDRKREGLLLDHSIGDNIGLGILARERGLLMWPRRVGAIVAAKLAELRIKAASGSTIASHLSGGNQQKVVLARCLASGADIFILDEPTAGVDVGAKGEIHRILRALADDGAAIVMFSADRDEIKDNADRVLVLSRGRFAAELQRHEITDTNLLTLGVNRRGDQ